MSKSFCFANATIFYPEGIRFGELFVKDGKISRPLANPDVLIDCQGNLLAPGLIDLQVNGIAGIDFTDSLDQLFLAEKELYRYGVTSFLAAIISQPLDRYLEIIKSFEKQKTTSCLGLHLEGPHINPEKRGAHPEKSIIPECQPHFWENLIDVSTVKMMTLAPELPRASELIDILSKKGIVAACGHTMASYELLSNANLSMGTHLFNAMTPLHHRAPGPIGWALGSKSKEINYSLIADRNHLHPAVACLAYHANKEGLILVSDCNALLSDRYKATLGGLPIELREKKAVIAGTDTLAGGTVSLFDCLINLQEMTGCTLYEALSYASLRPAKLLGIDHQKGRIEEGFDADLLLLSVGSQPKELKLLSCYVAGSCVFHS